MSERASLVAELVQNPPGNEGATEDAGLTLGSGRPPGVGNSHLLQYSCLENLMSRRAWQATVHRLQESVMNEHTCTYTYLRKLLKFILWIDYSIISDSVSQPHPQDFAHCCS